MSNLRPISDEEIARWANNRLLHGMEKTFENASPTMQRFLRIKAEQAIYAALHALDDAGIKYV